MLRSRKIQVVIAEDHAVVRMGLRALMSSEPAFTLVGEAVDGAEAVSKALRLKPDVIMMDRTDACEGRDQGHR